MAIQKFLTRIGGINKLITALVVSTGVSDAGKLVATGSNGRFDESVMPLGIGADTNIAVAAEDIGAGKFVQFFMDTGTFSVRLADNSNGRAADGFVVDAFQEGEQATVYPLDGVNSSLTGLTAGTRYFLGTAGGVTAVPLVEDDVGNANKVSQELGVAKSATELITSDNDIVIL